MTFQRLQPLAGRHYFRRCTRQFSLTANELHFDIPPLHRHLTPMCNYASMNVLPERNWKRFEIDVLKRLSGSRDDDKIREAGKIPLRVFRGDTIDMSLAASRGHMSRLVDKSFAFQNTVHMLNVRDQETDEIEQVLVYPRTANRSPVRKQLLSMSFNHYEEGAKMKICVPVIYERVGHSYGIMKQRGFMFYTNDRVWCNWDGSMENYPIAFRVDCKDLKLGDSVCWADMNIPIGLTPYSDRDENVEFCRVKKRGENDLYVDSSSSNTEEK
eukprot:872248_1